jgi:hypothetical protein
MKISISTTSKLYLLTLLVIFGAIFVNQSVFAQEDPFQTRSDKRMALLERYFSWIENKDYGDYKETLGQRTLSEFNSYLSRVIPENQNCLKESDDQKLSDCKEKIKFDYKLAKKFNRVLKYLQIQESKPNVCVKADMGVGKALKALPISDNSGPTPGVESSSDPVSKPEELVVYLCTGNNGEKLVRVLSPSGALLKLSPADAARPELAVQNLPPKDSVDLLIKKMGLTQPSGEISANPNPCTIASTAQTCGEVEVEWDVTDDTSDPVEVKTKDGKFIERSRNGSADITNIGPEGQTFILYSLGRKIGEVVVKAIKQ